MNSNYQIKEGERILTEQELATVSANERRASYYPKDTVLDFTGEIRFVGYQSSKGKALVKFDGVQKNGQPAGAPIPASMLMRTPFQRADALEKTEFQKQLNACPTANALWQLIKGRKIKVAEVVTVSEVPFGEDKARDIKYSVWDYA